MSQWLSLSLSWPVITKDLICQLSLTRAERAKTCRPESWINPPDVSAIHGDSPPVQTGHTLQLENVANFQTMPRGCTPTWKEQSLVNTQLPTQSWELVGKDRESKEGRHGCGVSSIGTADVADKNLLTWTWWIWETSDATWMDQIALRGDEGGGGRGRKKSGAGELSPIRPAKIGRPLSQNNTAPAGRVRATVMVPNYRAQLSSSWS